MALSRNEIVLLYLALSRHHQENEHLESPHFKEEIDEYMLREGYRPREGARLIKELGVYSVEKREPRGPDNCSQIVERTLCGERIDFLSPLQMAG